MSGRASFILRWFGNPRGGGSLGMGGLLWARLDEPAALGDLRVLVGGEPVEARFRAPYPAGAPRRRHLCAVRFRVPLADAEAMPFHSPVELGVPAPAPEAGAQDPAEAAAHDAPAGAQAPAEAAAAPAPEAGAQDPPGAPARVPIRYQAGLGRYLALHGPYLADAGSGLTAYFRQFYDKGTALTVRHANVTDRPAQAAKVVLARLLANLPLLPRPVLLYEKNCRHYEESASAVFERLVDLGVRDARFVLDGRVMDSLGLPARYRRQMVRAHTLAHYLWFFRSRRFVSSESQYHALELRCQSIWYRRKLEARGTPGSRRRRLVHVLLQHGVMYMVSLDSPERGVWRKRDRGPVVYPVVSSELEARHFVELAGYDRADLMLCGLPKLDRARMDPGADLVLVMPTWRPWEFQRMRSDPSSTGYARMLARMAAAVPERLRGKVVAVPHPLFDASTFAAPAGGAEGAAPGAGGVGTAEGAGGAETAEGAAPGAGGAPGGPGRQPTYDELLRRTRLLVTDYSSIAYDAYHRGADVVFYWEELDECMAAYGGPTRLMLDEGTAFGPVCRTPAELSAAVDALYGAGQPEPYRSRYGRIVELRDGRNTDRVVAELARRGVVDLPAGALAGLDLPAGPAGPGGASGGGSAANEPGEPNATEEEGRDGAL